MADYLFTYWPQIFFVLSVVLGVPAAVHATMTKEEVRAAIGWVGVIILSPVIGAVIYAVAGINRIRRSAISSQREFLHEIGQDHFMRFDATQQNVHALFEKRFVAMKTLGDRVSRCRLTTANDIDILQSGDEAYRAMLAEIERSERSILVETYIFDRDKIGLRLADALIKAVKRGVEVRVLIDAVGARYSIPSIVGYLDKHGVKVDVFNGNIIMGLRLPYANLRTHRKIMIIDGRVAFTGGMNIRAGFSAEIAGEDNARDTHFRLTGPIVTDLLHIASEDWRFTTGEKLTGEPWHIAPPAKHAGEPVFIRAVPSGPDRSVEANHRMLMGAFSIAQTRIRIMSPYFLPDRELISALVTAARRGVEVDIVVPAINNLKLVDRAMTAQFDQILKGHCRIWRASGNFNHSKLLVVDGQWAYVGSSNLDPRSLRLNFEVDLEVMDAAFASEVDGLIQKALASAKPVLLQSLRARSFWVRLLDRIIWLGSPYL
ncbi:phospholipase D-like domain-containing protein [Phyllobacterium endophyticum]|jgi:cardiolipin synthase|uniref:Phospholipase D n=1 Tax=Phyllobacterium endophyticum TaxID=1149773 RepID=A0A2P7B0H2_9HYPH|nr:phosphatidylserine/phosphatidylglycerophosphate/cardiolipin synthase family protein [Phyllobacterium endophyticum]MBB3235457.1 cardiolipin synthase [Phyllobacterium endophyticum]PSH59894.1 cardiolipin synthase [Phyllobacterium endophyticum]TYR42046.1 phosphatidylserine/phosphatidylglycerophosphate/cardiolipin synthase family protein [Phyllobacterium endophyticum]